ncbi:MAG: Gfo/Idh/MocA family oxidoreductase [Desulfobacterales bacterium]|nr:Gfo/Idh/MocA family oxidoreductase [Desulfobacterales bacterium]MDD4072122.1 Gfo/Idh/MocA family oxidoreductase [Desulfobacterales bacterium]MDD4392758.1 Gfo/Idh/MocA family oxidoreductase [Desulfobacterales bacterium]
MLRAGFIGFGRMGITHYSILNSHPSVDVIAVCDQSTTMLSILKKYVNVMTFTDYREMIEKSSLDFVIISTPPDSHAQIVQFALENNLHVFVEKPFTLSVAEGQNILSDFKFRSLIHQVGYVNRFNEVFIEVKKLVDEGVIGDVSNCYSEMYGATVVKDSKSGWRGHRKTGGGCLYDFASHCIDLAVYLLGQPEKVAGSVMQSIYSSGSEDLVSSTLIYENGCTVEIMTNWSDESFRKPTNILTVFGTKGKIVADKHAYKIFLKEADPEHKLDKGWNTAYLPDLAQSVRLYVRGNEFTRQLDYFVGRIRNETIGNIAGFDEAFKTDIVMEQIALDASYNHSFPDNDLRSRLFLRKSSEKPSAFGKK